MTKENWDYSDKSGGILINICDSICDYNNRDDDSEGDRACLRRAAARHGRAPAPRWLRLGSWQLEQTNIMINS